MLLSSFLLLPLVVVVVAASHDSPNSATTLELDARIHPPATTPVLRMVPEPDRMSLFRTPAAGKLVTKKKTARAPDPHPPHTSADHAGRDSAIQFHYLQTNQFHLQRTETASIANESQRTETASHAAGLQQLPQPPHADDIPAADTADESAEEQRATSPYDTEEDSFDDEDHGTGSGSGSGSDDEDSPRLRRDVLRYHSSDSNHAPAKQSVIPFPRESTAPSPREIERELLYAVCGPSSLTVRYRLLRPRSSPPLSMAEREGNVVSTTLFTHALYPLGVAVTSAKVAPDRVSVEHSDVIELYAIERTVDRSAESWLRGYMVSTSVRELQLSFIQPDITPLITSLVISQTDPATNLSFTSYAVCNHLQELMKDDQVELLSLVPAFFSPNSVSHFFSQMFGASRRVIPVPMPGGNLTFAVVNTEWGYPMAVFYAYRNVITREVSYCYAPPSKYIMKPDSDEEKAVLATLRNYNIHSLSSCWLRASGQAPSPQPPTSGGPPRVNPDNVYVSVVNSYDELKYELIGGMAFNLYHENLGVDPDYWLAITTADSDTLSSESALWELDARVTGANNPPPDSD